MESLFHFSQYGTCNFFLFLKYFTVSRINKTILAPISEEIKCLIPGNSKLKMCCKNGRERMSSNIMMAMDRMIHTAQLRSVITLKIFLVLERLVRIKKTFPITNEEKAIALTSSFVCPS